MSIPSAIVLFAVVWFVVMFVILPIRLRTQGDEGDVVEGTHAGAPANFRLGRTMLIVTGVTTLVWGVLVWVIASGMISIADFDWTSRGKGP